MEKKSGKFKIFGINACSVLVLVAGSFLFGMSLTTKGFASSPGSQSDPLVSQSYVDSKFSQLQTQISSITSGASGTPDTSGDSSNGLVIDTVTNISPEIRESILIDVMTQIEYIYGQNLSDNSMLLSRPVFVEEGNVVIGGEGTEIILRSGQAVGFVPGENGLSNVTNGTDILHYGDVPPNNLIFIPRDDGRGIVALTDIWIMVKGEYTILQ